MQKSYRFNGKKREKADHAQQTCKDVGNTKLTPEDLHGCNNWTRVVLLMTN